MTDGTEARRLAELWRQLFERGIDGDCTYYLCIHIYIYVYRWDLHTHRLYTYTYTNTYSDLGSEAIIRPPLRSLLILGPRLSKEEQASIPLVIGDPDGSQVTSQYSRILVPKTIKGMALEQETLNIGYLHPPG